MNQEAIEPTESDLVIGSVKTVEKIMEVDRAVEKTIPLVEMFGPTVQGEGTVIGQQTYFFRFGLCDYRCARCDSLHAVLPQLVRKEATFLTQQAIMDQFLEFRRNGGQENATDWVTFSGGNPAVHNLGYLLGLLKLHGFKVNVETQGTLYRGWLNKVDSLTISPKGPGMGETHNQKVFEEFIDRLYGNSQLDLEQPDSNTPNICVKIVVFDQRDLDFASLIFTYLKSHDLFKSKDTSNHFYLSLGNPYPPDPTGASKEENYPSHTEHMELLLKQYKVLYEDIQNDPVLSKVRFLPQWHFFVWGNDKGH